jgi:tRNA(Ile)-lysidine synthase
MSGMTDFLRSVRAACLPRLAGQAVLVGVSGGPDSVALLIGLAELRTELPGVRAAHVHHGWRGDAADADADWVLDLGRRLQVPTETLHVTPAQKSQHAGKSLEEGARDARYELLADAASRHGCGALAVGHTRDDQIETVLHHILRGTGLTGLAGMPSERPLSDTVTLVRPLLAVSRAVVLTFLESRGQDFRLDATNADLGLTRNRLRLELLPLLRAQFNPQVDAALVRLAEQAAESSALLDELSQQILDDALLEETDAACRLDAAKLARHSDTAVRAALRRLWIRRNWPRQEMGRAEWQRLARLVFEPGAVDFPAGLSARRGSGPLVVWRR